MGPAPVNSMVLGPCRRCKILEQDSRTTVLTGPLHGAPLTGIERVVE